MATISGTSAGDTLVGTAGDDTVLAGGGVDTFNIAAASTSATFSYNADGLWVVASTQGQDVLNGVEAVHFSDGTVNLGSLQEKLANTTTAGDQSMPDVAALTG